VVLKHSATDIKPYLIIVEDDPDDQEIMLETISRMNQRFSVHMLGDGDELFDLLDTTSDPNRFPTLIVLDYNLPRLGGEATLVLIKKDPCYRSIPVVLYSTGMTVEKEHDLLGLGANFCRKKPSSIDGINRLVGELIAFAHSLVEQRTNVL
jgi:CheY-like chemotaxis protein